MRCVLFILLSVLLATPVSADVLLGDVNLDGVVSFLDFVDFTLAYGSSDAAADLNNDGLVGILDLLLLGRALSTGADPYCGDGDCNGDETCDSCDEDCGECPDLNLGQGNFRHIDIFTFTRNMDHALNNSEYENALEWLAFHTDINEKDMDLKDHNPDTKIFRYALDLTIFTDTDDPLPSNEDAYLHFSETTVIQPRELDESTNHGEPITIPGCPGTATESCRISLYMWSDMRWVFNPSSEDFRTWQSERLLSRMNIGAEYEYDALFLDEHSPGFRRAMYMGQNQILSGGAIKEFGGLRPTSDDYDELDPAYSAKVTEWMTYLKSHFNAQGKFIIVNPAAYYWMTLAEEEYTAAGAVTLEHVHTPFDLRTSSYSGYITRVNRGMDNGVIMDLAGNMCASGGPYDGEAGNYDTPYNRYRMWRLAAYYQVRGNESQPGRAYFDPSFCYSNPTFSHFLNEWMDAYEYDIRDPLGETQIYSDDNSGNCQESTGIPYKVFSREYTYGLVLVRPKDHYNCNTYDDSTAITIALPQAMYMLKADGTLSSTTFDSMQMRNSEALILIKPGSPGT